MSCMYFMPCNFDGPSFSRPAFSVNPYRSGTDGRCCICARQALRVHSSGGRTALSCVKWRHDRHFEIMTSNRKSYSVSRCGFTWRTICQISSWSDLKRRSLGFFCRKVLPLIVKWTRSVCRAHIQQHTPVITLVLVYLVFLCTFCIIYLFSCQSHKSD